MRRRFYLVADVARARSIMQSGASDRCRCGGAPAWWNGSPARTAGRRDRRWGFFWHGSIHPQPENGAGDLIALYTDGLVEVDSPDERQLFTYGQLTGCVRRRANCHPPDLLSGVLSEIHEFSGRPEFNDDVCLVGMEVNGWARAVDE